VLWKRPGWRADGRLGVWVAVGVLVAGAAGCAGPASARRPRPESSAGLVVATAGGAVRGLTYRSTTEEFLGIPYAAAPVGALRWRPPQLAAPWHGVRAATHFGPHCPQGPTPLDAASTSENCLFVNVFAPVGSERSAHALPVMLWIHGGEFISGAGDDYDPGPLVRHGVIVVTINYRIGALGFLAHPALVAHPGGPAGNYGLMDQQAALRWVRRNIARFGGNPQDIAIFGESAGGLSVLAQLASPGARGLFSRAIVESATLVQASLARAEIAGRTFAAGAGCPGQAAACLRSLPVSAILAAQGPDVAQPVIDGQVLTEPLREALASGQFSRVPVIIGGSHDEGRLDLAGSEVGGAPPVTAANYRDMIESALGVTAKDAALIAAQYPVSAYPSPALALGAVTTDPIGACQVLAVDQWLSAYVPTYAYEFNDEKAPERFLPPVSFPYGATHESELQYLFDLPTAPFPGALSPAQQHLATVMQEYWTSFAKQGSPSPPASPSWPRFHSASHRILSLVPPQPNVETGFAAAHRCSFWARFPPG
jgi:para-nitrobenzyl esterase